jgi:dihydroxyacetone kinase-like protein
MRPAMPGTVARMRKLINDPADVVRESLAGFAAAHPDLVRVDLERQLVLAVDAPAAGRVAVVSGGGSGHEPMHLGFVGPGMLDAACPGAVFTSPSSDQILAATRAVNGGAGVVHVVKNYTGDVISFRLAGQAAAEEGIAVRAVVVDDDVAVEDSTHTAGRRGVGATLLAQRIAGAAAARGDDVDAVAALAARVNARARSLGVGLSSCTPPSTGRPIVDLPAGEMEVGIGIHGEPGRRRAPLGSAAEVAELMLNAVVTDRQPAPGARMLVFVNGMGGTPQMELYVVYAEVARGLAERGLVAARALVGSYVTSFEMAGASLTLLELDDELLELWDAPLHTAALRWGR